MSTDNFARQIALEALNKSGGGGGEDKLLIYEGTASFKAENDCFNYEFDVNLTEWETIEVSFNFDFSSSMLLWPFALPHFILDWYSTPSGFYTSYCACTLYSDITLFPFEVYSNGGNGITLKSSYYSIAATSSDVFRSGRGPLPPCTVKIWGIKKK